MTSPGGSRCANAWIRSQSRGGISRAAVRFSSEREGVVYTRALVKVVQEPAAGPLRVTTAAHALALLRATADAFADASGDERHDRLLRLLDDRVSESLWEVGARATAAPDRAMEVRPRGKRRGAAGVGSAGGSNDGSFEDAARERAVVLWQRAAVGWP